ncbi:Ribosomal protein S6 kinase alpha-5 [Trebouxia sp. C0009 RCD-2024]
MVIDTNPVGATVQQTYQLAIISASPDIGSVLITMNTNDGDRDSVHCEGGPLHKLQPSGSPTSVLDSMDLEMDFQYSGNEVVVPQLASVAWDNKLRALWEDVMPEPFEGKWCLQRCAWNPMYFELADHYPDTFSLIGSGAYGQVNAQYCDPDGSWAPVAVKVLSYATPQEVYLVDREVAAMKAVQGKPHLVTLLSEDIYAMDGTHKMYVVMRYLEMVDMEAHFCHLRQGFNWATEADLDHFLSAVIHTFTGIVRGVAHLHASNWAHMDLKPDNLCLELKDGQSYTSVVDLGSSLQQNTAPACGIQSSPQFAAPEVINHYLDPSQQAVQQNQISFFAQDMWSLGCILVWLLVGDDPFPVTIEELAAADMSLCEMLHVKQNLWAAYTGVEDLGGGALDALTGLVHYHPSSDRLQQLSVLVPCLLEHEQQSRPTASALLEEMQAIAALE